MDGGSELMHVAAAAQLTVSCFFFFSGGHRQILATLLERNASADSANKFSEQVDKLKL